MDTYDWECAKMPANVKILYPLIVSSLVEQDAIVLASWLLNLSIIDRLSSGSFITKGLKIILIAKIQSLIYINN